MENLDPMYVPIVTVTWCAYDLMSAYNLSEEKAVDVLDQISGILEDRSIELGWEVIDSIIHDYLDEELN